MTKVTWEEWPTLLQCFKYSTLTNKSQKSIIRVYSVLRQTAVNVGFNQQGTEAVFSIQAVFQLPDYFD